MTDKEAVQQLLSTVDPMRQSSCSPQGGIVLETTERTTPKISGVSRDPAPGHTPVDVQITRGGRSFAQPRVLQTLKRPLWIIAICGMVAAMRAAHEALAPLALALLLACVLSGIVEWLRRRGVPRGVSASLLLVLIALALVVVVDFTWSPAQQWMQNAPRVLHVIERRIRPAQSLLRRLDYIAQRATALASSDGESAAAAPPQATAPSPSRTLLTPLEVFSATGWLLTYILTVMAFALLLLIAGPPTLARMTVTLGVNLRAAHVLEVINAIRLEVGRYYGTMVLINLCFGLVVAGVMSLLGMPNPALWGAIAGALNFIPYLGSATTFAIVTVVALVTFSSIGHVLLVAGSYLGLAAIEGHLVEPVFFGRSLHLSPLLVLTALWLGGWLWGIPGVVLAVPVVVAARSVRRVSSRTRQQPLAGPRAPEKRAWHATAAPVSMQLRD